MVFSLAAVNIVRVSDRILVNRRGLTLHEAAHW